MALMIQPTLPPEGAVSDAEIDFIESSPPGLFPENQNSNFGLRRKIWTGRVQDLISQQITLYNERFIDTSSQYLDEWERQVGLPMNPSGVTLPQRRQMIAGRLSRGPFTNARRADIVTKYLGSTFGESAAFDPSGIALTSAGIPLYSGLTSLIGAFRIYQDVRGHTYAVWIKNSITPDIPGLTRELKRITPAGITFTIDNTQADVLRYASLVKNAHPVAYWRMGTVNDDSGNALVLTPNGAVATGNLAAPGLLTGVVAGGEGATTFDGVNDYFSRAAPTAISNTAFITLEGWFKINAFAASDTHRMIVSQGTRYISIYTLGAQNYTSFTVNVDGVQRYLTIPTSITLGTTHHMVGTFDGRIMRLYLDGVQVSSAALGGAGALAADGSNILVGAYGPAHFMNGTIDEVAIYDYALSADVILDHYNTGRDIATY